MAWRSARRIGVAATIAALLTLGSSAEQRAAAQNPVSPPHLDWQWAGDPALPYLQRSLEIYDFKKAAQSGPERGREIFYYKCWMCHNEYTEQVPGVDGPRLDGLFKRPMLVTGKPVTEDNVKDQIRNGSADMAAYKYTLSEADLNDLVSFLRDDCCWNSDAPPRNPRYVAH
jgi:mono/diheme cytochrome c family protein